MSWKRVSENQYILNLIASQHRNETHSKYCRPGLCEDIKKSHATNHELCNDWNCDVASQRHKDKNHSSCADYWCSEKRHAYNSNFQAVHNTHCNEDNCGAMTISHATDHKLCNPSFCQLIEDNHYDEDHSLCNSYWCDVKEEVEEAHENGTHDLSCDTDICPAMEKSHKGNHKLCNANFCDVIFKSHVTDHKKCNPYWCTATDSIKQRHLKNLHSEWCNQNSCPGIRELHKSGDHGQCRVGHCELLTQSHMTDHMMCNPDQCGAKDIIGQAHKKGVHSTEYCNNFTCPAVSQLHESGDHQHCHFSSFCNVFKQWMDLT